MSTKLNLTLLREMITTVIEEDVFLVDEEVDNDSLSGDKSETEKDDATTGLSGNIEQMSPKKAQQMAAEVFLKINKGQIANARSQMDSLLKTAPGRIALAVQALRWYGSASAEEINTNAAMIRKIASSVDAPPAE
jgi:hypothetical protein